MKDPFETFLDHIPVNIHNHTKTFIGKNITVFIPSSFVMDTTLLNDDYHFVIFQSAPPVAIINNTEYKLKSGSLLCMAPGTEITVKDKLVNSPPKYMAISIKKELISKVLMNLGSKGPKPFVYDCQYSCKLLNLLELFMQEFIYDENPSKYILDSIETLIVVQLFRDLGLLPSFHKSNRFQEISCVEQAIQYFETYYSSNIKIQDICNTLFISPSHFQRVFKKTTNKTPYQYVTELRIEKSKEKLIKEDTAIADIAKLCGFITSGHYSTLFKKSVGITPLQYRNLHRI